MRSTLPLRARTPGGKLAPVDLSLRESAEAFATANSNADLSIAKKAGDGTEFVAGGFSIAPEADAQASGGIESDGCVFYDDVTGAGSDTAFMVSPQPTGAELSWLLLSPQAPERLVLKVDLPVGAVLRRTRTDNPIPNVRTIRRAPLRSLAASRRWGTSRRRWSMTQTACRCHQTCTSRALTGSS